MARNILDDILGNGMMQADTGSMGQSIQDDIRRQANLEQSLQAMEEERPTLASSIQDESAAAGLEVPPPMPSLAEQMRDPKLDKMLGIGPRTPAATGTAPAAPVDIDADRQKGLNVFPFDPAINAYPDNPNWNPQVADKLKNIGMAPFTMPEENILANVPKPSLSLSKSTFLVCTNIFVLSTEVLS